MKVNPKTLTPREELNLRQGIKSSLPNMEFLIASIYTLFKICTPSKISFTEEYTHQGKTKIRLENSLESQLFSFFQNQISTSGISQSDLLTEYNKSPLFTAQIEALQVAIQLYWKLGEINFVQDMASSTERTGGERFNKNLIFSTNLDIIDNVLTDENNQVAEETKNLIFNYITGKSLTKNNLEQKLIKVLTVFSEEAQFKIRDNSSNEIFFQQEGIYSEIISNNTVINKDPNEDVGPFRILKSAVKENLNFYLDSNNTNGFILKNGITNQELENYLVRVNSLLNLNPKTTNIEIYKDSTEPTEITLTSINKIFYGAPGTGKSHKVKEIVLGKDKRTERVTFHPEYDYSSFVGGYKPTMDGDNIRYEFVPQAFTSIYTKAWNDLNNDYYLVIEEINRGNCAEIFGDIFQLLDRTNDYKITPSKELKEHLEIELKGNSSIDAEKLLLPPNLNILATMNTSDQSLFPMDSAFKRRWDWEYIPINYSREEDKNSSAKFVVKLSNKESFKWLDFIEKVNEKISKNDNLGMDKCLGNYFIKPENDEIEIETFINKAIFYLWNDVFKDETEEDSIFKNKTTYEKFFPIDNENGKQKVRDILDDLEIDYKASI
ncbi:AAA family ATPase [uncultured Polaribacter sp.]|uniref:McrB family protein n=1 Tax=uncultured Polaribacter sp. TaxID=174711 RepID=UPI002631AC00|nr:AAA family ATPase [uncultured Polaribacter sp.]